jgi:hypothetical protein
MYKISNITPIHPAAAELFHANEQTDMTKLTVDFRNSEKAPKKKSALLLFFETFSVHSAFTGMSTPIAREAETLLCLTK